MYLFSSKSLINMKFCSIIADKICLGRKTPKSDFGAFLASWLHQDQEPEPVNRETFQFNGPHLDRPEFCDVGKSYQR